MSDFYIPRKLRNNDEIIMEDEFFHKYSSYKFIILLAEPGAGKTALLSNWARKLGTQRHRANIFKNIKEAASQSILVIDGFDEVAKIDEQSAIDSILYKVNELQPRQTIISSRASEWDHERNQGLICDYLSITQEEIALFYLFPFDFEEQKDFFEHHCSESKFNNFYSQLLQLDLHDLIQNPQILNLFISSYKENKILKSKVEAFKYAIKNLVKEHNHEIPTKRRRPSDQIIGHCEEIFAKLLLSGVSGVSLFEHKESKEYPFLGVISQIPREQLEQIVDTGLFKCTDTPEFYEPSHRMIAEYCAANYIIKRVKNSTDQITLRRCFSIIAPSNAVRTELRGLLGWMASLSNDKTIQKEIVRLDAYAVLANGDPSQLLSSSKEALIFSLIKLSEENPYFRSSDWHRSFHAKNLISSEVVPVIKELLVSKETKFQLKSLLLTLVSESDVADTFRDELIALLIDVEQYPHIRNLAIKALITLQNDWDYQNIFQQLLERKAEDDLEYASKIVKKLGVASISRERVLTLLWELSKLYPIEEGLGKALGSRFFIKNLVQTFDLHTIEYFLDSLTQDISCTCAPKHEHQCICKNGISKIVGCLLDRYFELVNSHYPIEKLAFWLKNLRYNNRISEKESLCVKTLQQSTELRYNIYIALIKNNQFDSLFKQYFYPTSSTHAGLIFDINIYQKLINYAFETRNTVLWGLLFQHHSPYVSNRDFMISLRKLLRSHAKQDNDFMRIWVSQDSPHKKQLKENRVNFKFRRSKSYRSRQKKRKEIFDQKSISLIENKSEIKAGRHWGWLRFFCEGYLDDRNEIFKYAELEFIETVLINGLTLLDSELPSLEEVAQADAVGKIYLTIQMLYATSLAIFKQMGTLEQLSKKQLELLHTIVNTHFSEVTNDESKVVMDEVDSLLFQSDQELKDYIERYFSIQFEIDHHQISDIYWLLNKKEWVTVCLPFCLEWLRQYPHMNIYNLEFIFKYCINNNVDNKLRQIITGHVDNFFNLENGFYGPPLANVIQTKEFWLQAALFFTKDETNRVWEYFKNQSNSIDIFYDVVSPWSDDKKAWPNLSPEKIYNALDYFIEIYPPIMRIENWDRDHTPEGKAHSTISGLIKYLGENRGSVTTFDKLLADSRFDHFSDYLLHFRFEALKNEALRTFTPPTPEKIAHFFDSNRIGSVEDLRAYICEKLSEYQSELIGLETNPTAVFYEKSFDDSGNKAIKHVDENTARDRVVDWLRPRLSPLDINLNIETYMSAGNRCDFTATLSVLGCTHLLVVEIKGQWHSELFTAASEQLYKRYAIHPNAIDQGVFLVLWFGEKEKVANRLKHTIHSAQELKESIENKMPSELKGKIDIFVLDVSKYKMV